MSKLPRRRSLSARIRAAFLTLGLVAIGLTGWQSYRVAHAALEDAAYARLTVIRETKKRQIETYFRSVSATVRTLADGEAATDGILGFSAAGPAAADNLAVERLYGETLRGYAAAFDFEDVMLVDAVSRRTLYSLKGDPAAGVALTAPPYAGSNLATVVDGVLADPSGGARIVDFEHYPGADGAAASFAAAAVKDDGTVIGAFAVRLSPTAIDQVMTGGGGWREEGLGDTGETYLVGADGLMRSDSRFYLEDRDVYLDRLRARGVPEQELRRLREAGSTVLTQPAHTDAVRRALAGAASTSRTLDYRGVPVLSSFAPLNLPGLDWVLLSEIDEEEVFRPVHTLRNRLVALALAVSAAFLAAGYWFSRRTTRPLLALASEVDEIRRVDLDRSTGLDAFEGADDEVARLAESFRELTGRLRETTVSRDYLDNLLGSMLNAVFVVRESEQGPIIRSANRAADVMLGVESGALEGRPLAGILESGASQPEWLSALREKGQLPPIEKRLVDAAGRPIPVLFTAALVNPAEGDASDVVCVAQDITALARAQQELRVLARKLISAQEEERARIARELHDDITQRLGLLAIDAGVLAREPGLTAAAVARAGELKSGAIRLSEDVQHLSRSLHPSILDDLGLVSALGSETTALAKRLDIPVSFASEDPPSELSREARLALYRIAQECFHNIARHAGATEVNVELSVWDGRVRLVIEDDGRGFQFDDARGRGGLGLASMEERARLAGGELHVDSTPGRGTRIAVEIPVEAEKP
ncbi:MAG: ATP-binding protein [Bryobacterales bacterium]